MAFTGNLCLYSSVNRPKTLKHSYILDKPKSTIPTFVFFKFLCADGYLKFSLKQKVLPAEWGGKDTIKKTLLSNIISRLNNHMTKVIYKQSVDGLPLFKDQLEAELYVLLGFVKVTKTEAKFTFFEQFEQIIQDRKTGAELYKGKKFSPNTTKGYDTTINILKEWQAKTGYVVDWQTFDMNAYRALFSYLTSTLGLALNTVGSRLKNFKAFLKAAYERKWHTNAVFSDPGFVVPYEETVDIHLTMEELQRIAALELKWNRKIARDWFLIEAFTALRVSDVKRLKLVNISDNRITISNEKTDERVVLPIHHVLRKVLADNGNDWPPPLPEQKINEQLKQIARLAKITGTVLYSVTKAGVRVDEYIPRWQMVSNHTGRRCFVTNNIKAGTPAHLIKKMAGIKSQKTLDRYNKMSADDAADQAAELPFFKIT